MIIHEWGVTGVDWLIPKEKHLAVYFWRKASFEIASASSGAILKTLLTTPPISLMFRL